MSDTKTNDQINYSKPFNLKYEHFRSHVGWINLACRNVFQAIKHDLDIENPKSAYVVVSRDLDRIIKILTIHTLPK